MALGLFNRYFFQNAFGFILLIYCQPASQAYDAASPIIEENLLELKRDLFYFKGKPYTGSVVKFHSNKKKAENYSLKNGKLHGLWQEWNSTGQIVNQAKYWNGRLHGVFIQFRSDGSREFEVTYADGKENGSFKRWYEEDKIWVEENYFSGKLDGVSKTFFRNGKLQLQTVYQSGKKNGVEICWYDNGQQRWEIVYEEGKMKSKLRWKRDGTPSGQKLPLIF
ncbi:MAG: toxin-antitoxin system YwqK family antitoxin [Verrucomicrobiota bacterium]|nr:toxin-antitoxin system YwqK family antitoxin [Verrucomicrobiota bacterium]